MNYTGAGWPLTDPDREESLWLALAGKMTFDWLRPGKWTLAGSGRENDLWLAPAGKMDFDWLCQEFGL